MAKKKKKKFKLITSRNIGIIITLIIALYYLRFEPPIIQLAERKIYDYKVRSRGVRKVSDNVVIIGIDDKSVAALEGKYPINRGYVGECINILTSYYKPKVIGLDFVYPAPADPDGDAYFGQHVAFAKNVVFGTIFSFDPDVDVDYTVETSTALRFQTRSSIITEYGFRQYKKYFIKATDCLMNIPDVCYGAAGFGFVNVIQDSDGPIREAPMVIYFQDQYFPSFDVEIARLYFDVPQDEVYIRPGLGLSIGKNIFLPTNKNMNFLINYYGPHKTFKYYSFIDIMSKQVDKKDIEGKIVIFGVSGTAMTDMQTTPFSTEEAANLPGIEIHANILESIINDDFYLESSSTFFEMIEFLVLILFGVIIIIIISKTNLIGSFVFTGVFTFFYFLISQILFKKYGLILQSVFPVMLVIMVYISVTMYKYIIEEHEKRHIKKAFGHYISPNVMKEVLDNPELMKLSSLKRELTIMFVDVKSFTTYSESHTPEEVVSNLNVLLTLMTKIVLNNNGTLDKYIGDCLMAFWGAPFWFEDHAYWACKTGLEILKAIDDERVKREAEGKDFFEIGIGMNTGECVVGNMGSDQIMDYTVIGDAVNTAARVEGLTRTYDRPFVITEFTLAKVNDIATVEELGEATVKGKLKTFKVYNIESVDISKRA